MKRETDDRSYLGAHNTIQYVTGDATAPIDDGNAKIIAHICNDIGRWGRGFVLAISKRWSEPRDFYLKCLNMRSGPHRLGDVQYVTVEPKLVVANMIAQHGISGPRNKVPIRYDALRTCLKDVMREAYHSDATVHMPRIGTGLAGGVWQNITMCIRQAMLEAPKVAVIVYDLPER